MGADEVCFLSVVGAPEVQAGPMAPVVLHFHDLTEYPVFEDGPTQGMGRQLLRAANAQQVTSQACVQEIQLGCPDQSLAVVPREGLNAGGNIPGLKQVQPAVDGLVVHAHIAAQIGRVDELADSSCG